MSFSTSFAIFVLNVASMVVDTCSAYLLEQIIPDVLANSDALLEIMIFVARHVGTVIDARIQRGEEIIIHELRMFRYNELT